MCESLIHFLCLRKHLRFIITITDNHKGWTMEILCGDIRQHQKYSEGTTATL